MSRVLIVKTSSMGDVIHTLPAITDAQKNHPDIIFDWVVEPAFAEIPRWHPAVQTIIDAPLRRWRKAPWQTFYQGEWQTFMSKLRQHKYDKVIDAQGIIKSALVACFAKGPRFGFDTQSARGRWVSLSYHQTVNASQNQHAVEKNRQLFAQVLAYPQPLSAPDYGIDYRRLSLLSYGTKTVVFLHGTTWTTKHWPKKYWQQLAVLVAKAGLQVLLPWGNDTELARAHDIKNFCKEKNITPLPEVLPKLTLGEITSLIAKAQGVVAVDTGLGHIAAAMAVPTVSLYGPTDPNLTGAYGPKQTHLSVNFACAPCLGRECSKGRHFATLPPCFETLPPERVWSALMMAMNEHSSQPIFVETAQHENTSKIF